MNGRRFFLGIALNASLWTLLATAAIAGLAFPDDPDAAGEWGLTWLVSLPFVLGIEPSSRTTRPCTSTSYLMLPGLPLSSESKLFSTPARPVR